MTKLILYHNPKCSTSRRALGLLQDKDIQVKVVQYLKTPLTKSQLSSLLGKLNIAPHSLLRERQQEYKQASLSKTSSKKEILSALSQYPILMQRPILVVGNKAKIARPPEMMFDILP